MQLNTIDGEANKVYLKETSRRINTMSLVHEMLYTKDDSGYILLKDYMTELVDKLKDLIYNNEESVKFEMNIDNGIKFNISNSVAIGIITSEVVSNAIKYAFDGIKEPTVHLDLHHTENENHISYTIRDNGNGMDHKNKGTGLGSRLINIFARQLDAEYEVTSKNGVAYSFRIPYDIK